MNKLIFAGALALGLVLTAQQEASAWCKWSVNAGVSINYEGGNNSWLWGAFNSGQVPGYPSDALLVPSFAPASTNGYPTYGGYYGHADYGTPHAPHTAAEPPVAAPQAKSTTTQAIYYPNAYQPAAYGYSNTGSYQYNYSPYGNGFAQQVPSYWYGR